MTNFPNIPFCETHSIHSTIDVELKATFNSVLRSGNYILGSEVSEFEDQFAEYCGVDFCAGVGNGLDALTLSLLACDIGVGHEVIVPSNTFIATWLAVAHVGAKPVPVEPNAETYNIDPTLIEAKITAVTKAIIVVHLYGQPADISPILEIADRHGLVVIEDAAQAHGALYEGRRVGSLGHIAAVSFYPTKNLGCLGDGGAVLTNDRHRDEKVRLLRNYGSEVKYKNKILGVNSRLDELQAAILKVKLKRLDELNARRTKIAALYTKNIKNVNIQLPIVPDFASPVWHLYVVRTTKRQKLQEYLMSMGIETAIHYPIPPHKQECFANYGFKDLELSEEISREILSLPIYYGLSDEDVIRVANCINKFD